MARADAVSLSLVGAGLAILSGCEGGASTLTNSGVSGTRETLLGAFLLIVAAAVVVVIGALVLIAAFRHREPHGVEAGIEPTRAAVDRRWILIGGILIPVAVLATAYVFTVGTLDAVASPGHPYAASVTLTGHQWWWEAVYQDSEPAHSFTAANEVHLPVGEPVYFGVQTADVIHSFWVPELAGKIELIPGRQNSLWLEARVPGVFVGLCSQYCGTQHAHMRITVVAESPDAFHGWLARQRESAPAPADSTQAAGQQVFLTRGCASCHTIRGTGAGGAMGPDLTHLASRHMLGAGAMPNTPPNLMAWIQDAQGIKPGSDMPRMDLPPRELEALVAYLETLR